MKYKIIKVVNDYSDYDSIGYYLGDTLPWRECSSDEFEEITKACQSFNNRTRGTSVLLISDEFNTDDGLETLINDHRQYMAEIELKERQIKEKQQKDKERKAEQSRIRQLKQLEKLKKELEQ